MTHYDRTEPAATNGAAAVQTKRQIFQIKRGEKRVRSPRCGLKHLGGRPVAQKSRRSSDTPNTMSVRSGGVSYCAGILNDAPQEKRQSILGQGARGITWTHKKESQTRRQRRSAIQINVQGTHRTEGTLLRHGPHKVLQGLNEKRPR